MTLDKGVHKVLDLCIVGAGPAGVEAALQADHRSISYVLLDKDIAGSLIERTMAQKRFFHAYGRNTRVPSGLLEFPDHSLGHELVLCWHKQLEGKRYIRECGVQGISVRDGVCTIEAQTRQYHARYVLLASGTHETPRTLGVPGEQEHHASIVYQFDYGHDYGDGPFVVIGGGNSALETAVEISFDQDVVLVVRKDHFAESVTDANKADIEELIKDGRVRVLWQQYVQEIRDDEVIVVHNNTMLTLPFTTLFVHAGYHTPTTFLAKCGIELENEKPVCNEHFQTNVPELFIAGSLAGADSVVESADQAIAVINYIDTREK
ncbi:MAG: NAD(P)/FAD-dependent oxidoreductase [bacterium]|nr:NAD(P)/FAD-dependent oxidoreductase [bacterium]